MTSVPRLKISSTDDSPVTDLDRVDSNQGTPLSSSSRLKVIMLSTSSADRPMASVCTSTTGGANSGNTSTGILRNCTAPNSTSAAAALSTRKRSFRLDPTIQDNMVVSLFVVTCRKSRCRTAARRRW